MQEKTSKAIKALYKVFQNYRFTDMEGDPAFPGLCDPAPLLAEPLPYLMRNAFDTFAWKAVTTWGTADDLRHFLPRMLELLAEEGDGHPLETWALFGKIAYAKWRDWPAVQQTAIEDFVQSRCFDLLHQDVRFARTPSYLKKCESQSISDIMHAIQFLDSGLYENLLGQWSMWIDEDTSITPVLLLAELFISLFEVWQVFEPSDRFRDWLLEQERIKQLSIAWEKWQNDDPIAQYLSDAHAAAEQWIARNTPQ